MSNAPPAPLPPAVPPAAKKKSGCLVALAVAGGVLLLFGSVGLGIAWHYGLLARLGLGAKLVYDGVKELRALGCDQVMVLDSDDLGEVIGKTGPHNEKRIVTCLGRSANVPTCDEAAAAYVRVVGKAEGGFVASVRKTDGAGDRCSERYEEDGARAQ
jgi:hypothetical protein